MNCFSSSPRSWVSPFRANSSSRSFLCWRRWSLLKGSASWSWASMALSRLSMLARRPATTAARAGRLQTFEIATDGEPLLPAFGKGRLVLHAHGPPRCTTLVIRHLPIFPLVRVRYAILDDKSLAQLCTSCHKNTSVNRSIPPAMREVGSVMLQCGRDCCRDCCRSRRAGRSLWWRPILQPFRQHEPIYPRALPGPDLGCEPVRYGDGNGNQGGADRSPAAPPVSRSH